MGLDVYTGPLPRYCTGNWQLITPRYGASHRLPIRLDD